MPDLGALIADFLADAETSGLYTREQLREQRGRLAHVIASDLGSQQVDAIRGRDVGALVDELRMAGVSERGSGAIVEALRPVFAYAIGRGILKTSPLVGLATGARQTPSPTAAIVALGEHLVTWTVRGIVIVFMVTAVGLVVALA